MQREDAVSRVLGALRQSVVGFGGAIVGGALVTALGVYSQATVPHVARAAISDIVTVTNSVVVGDGQSGKIVTANCPAGKQVISGGGNILGPTSQGSGSDVPILAGSLPFGTTGWSAVGVKNGGPEFTVVAYALCATVDGTSGQVPSVPQVNEQTLARANEEDSPRKMTDEQRQQRQRTNRANRDQYATEGDVLAVYCDADIPNVTIANRDGMVQIQLLKDAAKDCNGIQIGDYLLADGEKQTEQLFEADDIWVDRVR